MAINTIRLAAATAGLWALFAIPMTQSLPDIYGLINFAFWYALMLYPVWVTFGWRWISEGTPIPFKLWGGLTVWAGIAALAMSDLSGYREIFWLPLATTAALLTFTIIFDGWESVRKTPSDAIIAAWRRPPVWLVLVVVMLLWIVIQTFVDMFTPKANLTLLVGAGAAWVGHLLLRK